MEGGIERDVRAEEINQDFFSFTPRYVGRASGPSHSASYFLKEPAQLLGSGGCDGWARCGGLPNKLSLDSGKSQVSLKSCLSQNLDPISTIKLNESLSDSMFKFKPNIYCQTAQSNPRMIEPLPLSGSIYMYQKFTVEILQMFINTYVHGVMTYILNQIDTFYI